ncbi:SDR family NAD(P)-dependent oxidoreductase [Methylocapsa sp. S129]|uniref:SDR family NAD(P)-dependent oxidoreductase n=1 Tax=Methylocapsa sp. S129 TaxID=1641869 RepID=UPI00131BA533|nr:SDR family oxidoreductase [Methylocapsa sp. S129]
MKALQGRRLLIVGGAAGIGLATVRQCLDAGAQTAVLDRDPWTGGGAPTIALQADVRNAQEVDAAVKAAAGRMGAIDGIIYCAGVDLLANVAETRDEDWERILDVNLTGAMRVCRAALRDFAPEGGTIVLVSSAAGLRPLPDRTAYCASKAGLVMFAKAMAVELAQRSIRVNAICPGAVETELFRSSFHDASDAEAVRSEIRDRYALRRIADPEEMASCILFLTSAASSYVTGIALAADGGRSFH